MTKYCGDNVLVTSLILAVAFLGLPQVASAVLVMDNVPTHTSNHPVGSIPVGGWNDYIGRVTTSAGLTNIRIDPDTVNDQVDTSFVSLVAPLDSIAGRDLDALTSPDLNWTYDIAAGAGEHLTSISFTANAFYGGNAGYEPDDTINFELFVDGFGSVGSITVNANTEQPSNDGSDAMELDLINLLHAGSMSVTSASVTVTVAGFGGSDESFFTSGTLQAQSIPEPSAFLLLGLVGASTVAFKKRRFLRWARR